MREAGFGGGFTTYRNLTIDNGSDIAGADATGDFVEVTFDENDNRVKKPFAKWFEGVILLPRAVLTFRDKTKTKKKTYESEEFNPLLNKKRDGANALIPIYKLDFNGQRQKDQNGKFIVNYAFYEDLKAAKDNGVQGMDFVYTIVLYVLVDGEIVKIRFRGAGRGNFFNFQKNLWKEYRAKAPEVYTKFSTYIEKKYTKYAIKFDPVLKDDGEIKLYEDKTAIENNIGDLLQAANDKKGLMLPPTNETMLNLTAPPQPQQPQPTQVTQQDMDTGLIPNTQLPPVEVYENQPQPVEDEDDIKIEDIPF